MNNMKGVCVNSMVTAVLDIVFCLCLNHINIPLQYMQAMQGQTEDC